MRRRAPWQCATWRIASVLGASWFVIAPTSGRADDSGLPTIAALEPSSVLIADAPLPLMILSSVLLAIAAGLGAAWLGPAWDKLSQRHISDIAPRLKALGIDETEMGSWLRYWGLAMFATFLVFGVVLQMIPVALGMVFVLFVSPRLVLDSMIKARQIKIRDQLVRATVGIANGCRAGMGLAQAIEKVIPDTPKPLATELTRIVRYCKGGARIQDVLREAQERLNLEAFTVFSTSAIVAVDQGGNLSQALEKISENMQETQRLERKLEADSASGRRLALILSMFPFAFLLLFTFLDPVSMGLLYTTFIGNLILCLVGFIVFVSYRWCQKILDIDF